jgi:hypothetical protein
MLVIALIALIQLAVLVMILAVVTSPSDHGNSSQVQPREQIHRLQDLTIETMFAEAARADRDAIDGDGYDVYQ